MSSILVPEFRFRCPSTPDIDLKVRGEEGTGTEGGRVVTESEPTFSGFSHRSGVQESVTACNVSDSF